VELEAWQQIALEMPSAVAKSRSRLAAWFTGPPSLRPHFGRMPTMLYWGFTPRSPGPPNPASSRRKWSCDDGFYLLRASFSPSAGSDIQTRMDPVARPTCAREGIVKASAKLVYQFAISAPVVSHTSL